MNYCRVCGKRFYVPDADDWGWILPDNKTLVCSYHCMRDVEKGRKQNRKKLLTRPKKQLPNQDLRDWLKAWGITIKQAAAIVGIPTETLYWRIKSKEMPDDQKAEIMEAVNKTLGG